MEQNTILKPRDIEIAKNWIDVYATGLIPIMYNHLSDYPRVRQPIIASARMCEDSEKHFDIVVFKQYEDLVRAVVEYSYLFLFQSSIENGEVTCILLESIENRKKFIKELCRIETI